MKKKIYISGKITGLDEQEAIDNFFAAETRILGSGNIPINPLKIIPYKEGLTWNDYMAADIKALVDCDEILMLPNYKDSKGALLELQIALGLGLTVRFLK